MQFKNLRSIREDRDIRQKDIAKYLIENEANIEAKTEEKQPEGDKE